MSWSMATMREACMRMLFSSASLMALPKEVTDVASTELASFLLPTSELNACATPPLHAVTISFLFPVTKRRCAMSMVSSGGYQTSRPYTNSKQGST
jgi:hypothetical protein